MDVREERDCLLVFRYIAAGPFRVRSHIYEQQGIGITIKFKDLDDCRTRFNGAECFHQTYSTA